MGLKVDFLPHIAEQKNPRPKKLYYDSLTMYNYSLAASSGISLRLCISIGQSAIVC